VASAHVPLERKRGGLLFWPDTSTSGSRRSTAGACSGALAAGLVPRERSSLPPPNLTSLKKDELIELADKQGVDTAGTKADIIERLSDE
jgi:hypothetical protein